MRVKRGLTLGKFLPLHHGHELLLTTAASYCDELVVLIGTTPQDPYAYALREKWVRELLAPSIAQENLHVINDPDPDPDVAKDAEGTVIDEHYWSQWLDQNSAHLAGVERVFTSDPYGAQIARRANTQWFPVDPDRSVNPISGSNILANPGGNFRYVSAVAKPDVALTVAVLGAESTGKSTLVTALATRYGCGFAPEWGRVISEVHPELDATDFDAIVDMQTRFIRSLHRNGNGLCITDTEAITTALFAPIYLGREHTAAWEAAAAQDFDLYLLLAPSVPWINDGTRILDQGEREQFHAALVAALEKLDKPYVVIDDASFAAREHAAYAAVDGLLEQRNWHLGADGLNPES